MVLTITSVVFLVVALGWIALPLLPAFHELVRRTDAEPLRVVRRSDTDVRHFATGFRNFLQRHFAAALEECAAGGAPLTGDLEDGTPYQVLPASMSEPPHGEEDEDSDESEDPHLTLSCGNLNLPGATAYPREIYSRGSLHTGDESALRAALADKSIYLGDRCTSFRWLHAGVELHTGDECCLYGRVSADRRIKLGDDCRFERLHAPTIEFGEPVEVADPPVEKKDVDLSRHARLVEEAAGRFLLRGKVEIEAGAYVRGDVVVTGELVIGDAVYIEGNLKAHDLIRLGRGARITGSVVSGGDLELGDGCVVGGPVVAEQKAEIGAGCRFGSEEHPTTLSARGLRVGPGVVAHGTVWGGIA